MKIERIRQIINQYNTLGPDLLRIKIPQDEVNNITYKGKKLLEMTKKELSDKEKELFNPNANGKKYDAGKPMVGTLCRVFPRALMEIGKCIEFGTHKYPDPNNWKKVEGAKNRYLDSLMRHLLKHLSGNELDEETGLPHLAHCAWNALAILELRCMDTEDNKNNG